jgi:hypothetical protein
MEALVRRLREAQRGESQKDLQRHQARRVPVGIRNHQMRATTSHQERRQGLQEFLRPPEDKARKAQTPCLPMARKSNGLSLVGISPS